MQSLHEIRVHPFASPEVTPEVTSPQATSSCGPVLSRTASSPARTLSRRVTVVGGKGLMGRFFVQQFSEVGHKVNVLERDNWHHAKQLLEGVDLVLLCVPIEYTADVIRDIAAYLSPETAMADITSIKEPIVQTMLAHHCGPVMGLHPMFGPNVNSFRSQTIAVCPGRDDEAFQWLLDLIEQAGGKLTVCTPAEHDRMMLTIQGVRHFATFSLGIFLAGEEIDLQRSLDLASPSYRELIGMVNRLFAQSPELVADIMLFNQERRETIAKLAETYSRLAQLAMDNDRTGLIHEFRSAQQVWTNLNS